MSRKIHEQPCNPSHIVAEPKLCKLQNVEGNTSAWSLPLERTSACGLREGGVNAGGSQAGISGWGTFGGSILYLFRTDSFRPSDPSALRIFQRQLQFPGQRIDRGPGLLPDALAFKPHVAD